MRWASRVAGSVMMATKTCADDAGEWPRGAAVQSRVGAPLGTMEGRFAASIPAHGVVMVRLLPGKLRPAAFR
jgi:hypothetical protein